MKVKKISGNYREIAGLLPEISLDAKEDDAADVISIDIPRTPFIGTPSQHEKFNNTWLNHGPKIYSQGDTMGGAFIEWFYITKVVNAKQGRAFSYAASNKKLTYNAYMNDCNEVSGLAIFELKDQTSCWMISIITNANAELEKRSVTIFFSEQAHNMMGFESATDCDFEKDFVEALKLSAIPQEIAEPINKIKIATQLALLKQNIDKLESNGYSDDAAALLKLVEGAKKASDQFFNLSDAEKKKQAKKLQEQCDALLKEAKPLMHYDSWDRFFVNLLLFVLLAGIIYLAVGAVKYLVTGRFLLYSPHSESEKNIEGLETVVQSAFLPSS